MNSNDYLHCDEYRNKRINDVENNIALFRHENGMFYFVLYESDGDIKLRSEGFETAHQRDEELSGVLKFHHDRSHYRRIEKGVYYLDILYDKSGREVGRSCIRKIASRKKHWE